MFQACPSQLHRGPHWASALPGWCKSTVMWQWQASSCLYQTHLPWPSPGPDCRQSYHAEITISKVAQSLQENAEFLCFQYHPWCHTTFPRPYSLARSLVHLWHRSVLLTWWIARLNTLQRFHKTCESKLQIGSDTSALSTLRGKFRTHRRWLGAWLLTHSTQKWTDCYSHSICLCVCESYAQGDSPHTRRLRVYGLWANDLHPRILVFPQTHCILGYCISLGVRRTWVTVEKRIVIPEMGCYCRLQAAGRAVQDAARPLSRLYI